VRGVFLPFGWGNVTKLALAYFFSTLYFYIPVGTLYLRGHGLTYVQINSMWGIIVGTMFLAEVPTGVIADLIGRKWAISVAFGLQLLGEVIYIFARGYGLFALSAVVAGLGFAFASGCVEALVYDALKARDQEGEMTKAMGYIDAAQRTANLIAFAVGGVLVSGVLSGGASAPGESATVAPERFVMAIVVTACAVALGLAFSLTVREDRPALGESVDSEGRAWRQTAERSLRLVGDGLRLLQGNRLFARLVLLSLFTIPFRDYLGSLYQPHFAAAGVPVVWFGVALSLASGLSIVGARYAYRLEEWLGPGAGLLAATALPGVLYLVIAVVSHPAFAVLAFCALAGSMSVRGPILSGRMNAHIASENRATVLSLVSMLSGIYVTLMGLLFGQIADWSVPHALAAMGLVVLAGSVFFRVGVEGSDQ
jgi:MFS family permease